MRKAIAKGVAVTALATLLPPATALATAPDPGDYGERGVAGFRNIVPPGQNGLTNAAQAADFLANGVRPPHQYDQNDMYANLVYAAPGLTQATLGDFYKDASFGVKPGDVERTYTPNCLIITAPSANSDECDDVTIVRDQFGIPHVYGDGRAGLMFGLGYVTGEDRLVLADILRHTGRGQLSSFVGGSQVGQDHDTWSSAPYMNDEELQLQYDRADDLYDEQFDGQGTQVQEDAQNYVDGMNQWIAEMRLNPLMQDAVYAALGRPQGPDPWKVTDVLAAGALLAGIFGKGGGGEVGSATSLQAAKRVLGRRQGKLVWKDFRSADDREAPRTIHRGRFPYRTPPKHPRGLAMPDPGSVQHVDVVASTTLSAREARRARGEGMLTGILDTLRGLEGGSNALLVSRREAAGGHPVAVFGPQTSYYAPQLLMEQDAHAPGGPEGPAIDARGVAFVGTNLYVQVGHGRDYAWSATSAGNDITDAFAVNLCEPGGGTPTIDSMGYRWNGDCLPIEVLERHNAWTPNAADMTPPGEETLRAYRTKVGLITHRATMNGKPIAYTKLRATYFHEVDSAGAFADWNSPEVTRGPKSWARAAYKNDLTFNWFYVDDDQIAYFNSGANPVRARGTHPNFPVKAKRKFLWRDFDEDLATFRREPIGTHPQVIDQRFLTSWNNKQALGYRNDGIRENTSVYRVDSLDERIKDGIRGGRTMSLVELVDAMEDAGTVDLRGSQVVPWALKLIGKPSRIGNPDLRSAVTTMRAWVRDGAHRIDRDNDGVYDHADAVRIIDAWWPLWLEAQFEPSLGPELHEIFIGHGGAIHDAPRAQGSAFQGSIYGFPEKDLRAMLGKHVRSPYSRTYCGEGKLRKCRRLLRRTLKEAAATSFEDLYGTVLDDSCEFNNGTIASPQMCGDAVNAVDVTVASIGPFHWINRPTFQQAVEVQGHR
jgi:acyl-homoserine lactone acylase PvdQ